MKFNFLITERYKVKNNKKIYYLEKNWPKFFLKLNSKFFSISNYNNFKNINNFDCLIISGGGDINNISKNKEDKQRDKFEIKLFNHFLKHNKPIIAICRGFQLIGSLYKNKLVAIKDHVKKSHKISLNKNIYLRSKNLITNSFHNYAFLKLNKNFKCIGKSKDNSIEIAILKKKKVLCLMFHPERKNINQLLINKLIINFLSMQ
jgi:gamma-glutamyl-gamma-aminobutyrate hydrolase PuuD